ncbi:MAG: hypothetical protein AB7T14_00990 [Candidatus Methylacidiphilaceae bacterium]
MLKRIAAFGEDFAHKIIVDALIVRVAQESQVRVEVAWRSARRGYGKVVSELKEYYRDLKAQGPSPELIVIATDANCKGFYERAKEIPSFQPSPVVTVLAIPDPHVERWLLLDGAAFRKVFGKGCVAPDLKCARDRYKQALIQAIREAGIEPALGGVEFAKEIIDAMDLPRAANADRSFARFLDGLRDALR